MPNPITVDKNSEFFISILKDGVHSSLQLGVLIDGKPELLASVGKVNLIDKSFGLACSMYKKMTVTHTDAFLVDEDVTVEYDSCISYQAYSITYHQYLEFLALIKDIHQDQLDYYKDRKFSSEDYRKLTYPERGVYKLKVDGIDCYLPQEETEATVTFEYKRMSHSGNPSVNNQPEQAIIDGAKQLSIRNTCRTTARAILNYVLHYSPNVPALYAVGLEYRTRIVCGKLAANTFYVLPQPPNCFDVSPAQMKVLKTLYKKIENTPKSEPISEVTRQKFDELKSLYKEISGDSKLSLGTLLDKITIHRAAHNSLFDTYRGQSIVSKFAQAIGIRFKTGTQKVYDRMENAVRKEIKRLDVVDHKRVEGVDDEGHETDQNPGCKQPGHSD